jgi:hypothetical protein
VIGKKYIEFCVLPNKVRNKKQFNLKPNVLHPIEYTVNMTTFELRDKLLE